MQKKELSINLLSSHQDYVKAIALLDEEAFIMAKKGKWSAGQQFAHIKMSIKPLVKAFLLPKFILKLIFGKANRPSKNYAELVAKYHAKLAEGNVASSPFSPKEIPFQQKEMLIKSVTKLAQKLTRQINTFSEKQLDEIILPHPLLGKITVREMIYFTIYHVKHHQKLTQENSL